jgi:hypothetical protein
MPTPIKTCISGFLLFALTTSALAENAPTVSNSKPSQGFDQVVYKGLVGNALEAVPMDPTQRVNLQRTNAVVSNTLSGRSLTVLAKLTNPAILIGSIAWGLWAAANINSPAIDAPAAVAADAAAPGSETIASAQTTDDASDETSTRYSPQVTAQPHPSPMLNTIPHPRVVKIWLAQPAR